MRRHDLCARGKAAIQHPHRLELPRCRNVILDMPGLPQDRLLPRQPEPVQIFIDAVDERLARSPRIDILDTQQKPSAKPARRIEGNKRAVGVPEMQRTVR